MSSSSSSGRINTRSSIEDRQQACCLLPCIDSSPTLARQLFSRFIDSAHFISVCTCLSSATEAFSHDKKTSVAKESSEGHTGKNRAAAMSGAGLDSVVVAGSRAGGSAGCGEKGNLGRRAAQNRLVQKGRAGGEKE